MKKHSLSSMFMLTMLASSIVGNKLYPYVTHQPLGAFTAYALKDVTFEKRIDSAAKSNIFSITSQQDLQKLKNFHKTKTILLKVFLPGHLRTHHAHHVRWHKLADAHKSSLIFASVDHAAQPSLITGLRLSQKNPVAVLMLRGDNLKQLPSLDEEVIKKLIE